MYALRPFMMWQRRERRNGPPTDIQHSGTSSAIVNRSPLKSVLMTADKFARRHGTRIYLLNTKIAPAKSLGIVDHTMIHGSKIRAELSPRTTRKDKEAEIQGIRSGRPTRKPSQSARVSVAYPRRLAERKYSAS